MSQSQWVIDVTAESFEREVIERSDQVPVLLDFWAAWCAPCRQLAPLLAQLADEYQGKFIVAKVDTDREHEIASQFPISGIPAVFAVKHRKIVDQFVGLLPPDELRQFIESLFPTAEDQILDQASASEMSDPEKAETLYRQVLSKEEGNAAAKVGLARVLLEQFGRENEAAAYLSDVDVGEHAAEAERLKRIVTLRERPHSEEDLSKAEAAVKASPEAAAPYLDLGAILAARGEYADALETLINGAELDKALASGDIRKLMLEIFQIVGVRSDLSDSYRDRLRAILY